MAPKCGKGNVMVCGNALMLVFSCCKDLAYVLEQPENSMMWMHPSLIWIKQGLAPFGNICWYEVVAYIGLGGSTLKPHVLYSNEQWVAHVRRPHPRKIKAKRQLCRKWIDRHRNAKEPGAKALKESQAHTDVFGDYIAEAFIKYREAYNGSLAHRYVAAQEEIDFTPDAGMAWEDTGLYGVLEVLCQMMPSMQNGGCI